MLFEIVYQKFFKSGICAFLLNIILIFQATSRLRLIKSYRFFIKLALVMIVLLFIFGVKVYFYSVVED